MPFETAAQAEDFIFSSYMAVESRLSGPDAETRSPELARQLLDAVGEPDATFTSIVVAGSKGKGSIAFLTSKLLESFGYRVGLVTSPHLVNFRERIRFNGRAIPPEDFVRLVNRVEGPAREIIASLPEGRYLSPAGIILAVASLYFAEQDAEFAVVEAGRGGQYDDSVVLDNPLVLFGPILLEHPAQLGGTLAEIAATKAALLKSGGVGVSAPQEPEVLDVMVGWSYQVGGGLVVTGRDVQVINPRIVGDKLHVSVQARYNLFEDFTLAIPALYEATNLAVALSAFEIVRDEQELQMDEKEILREAMANLKFPGRMQTLSESPFTLLDGAIARSSAQSVLESLSQDGRLLRPLTAIVGVPADKDWKGVLWELSSVCDHLILTGVRNPRLKFAGAEAVEFARSIFPASTVIEEAGGIAEARAMLGKSAQLPATTLILGTQSLLADTLRDYNFDLEQI
ncbi:MAG: hypothetical protein J0I20_03755 [Chloroflexi bacterium]|nr:hypothetical protein [Chloroflexota bacterium]OJV89144.1 MAG: hypothetical protein BGO39_34595 [Chloroflexi bacterium 54-19]